jgi:hypothetical protein
MNKEELRELLVEKYDYRNSQVDGVVEQISSFSPTVAVAFEKWLETGLIDDTGVGGYTVKSIMETRPMKVVAAYLTLGWLENDPDEAMEFLNEPVFNNVFMDGSADV